ncbi:MAG TPA: molecular chaperone TorD family protein [Terriglobales bacterium]|nr:molecular chaperone TorD family protein [Terriglobales bacterium]
MQAIATELSELEAKAGLYSLLAQAFNYPDKDLVNALRGGEFLNALAQWAEALGHPSLLKTITACHKEYAGKQPGGKADLLLDMERDYTRMFFASKPRLAYLFESVYREGKLLQESTFQIARLYADAGLKLTEDFRLPPDHIAVELEFLSFLVFKEIEGTKKGKSKQADYARELQAQVIDEHLGAFAASIGERVMEHARTNFYRTVALILKHCFSEAAR